VTDRLTRFNTYFIRRLWRKLDLPLISACSCRALG